MKGLCRILCGVSADKWCKFSKVEGGKNSRVHLFHFKERLPVSAYILWLTSFDASYSSAHT